MGRIGPGEILLLALIALLLFGATRIADIGKGLGEGIRNFKKGLKDADEPADPPKQLTPSDNEKKALDTACHVHSPRGSRWWRRARRSR